ncbi:hypothetical protein JG687_00005148 [Phytophthora cactorum]|uniref:Uncharacterized protein n=1 Tax=Phytophthora cactorum TaxID=29920 RepID=A0A8T1UPK8_9STRA|nr:hypothetical protein JG687_00005148 [Phytophthora cactorum]
MAASYAAYATQVSEALQTLLETTRVKVEPAVEFVSCGAGLNEHFVPKTSLEMHLFYYGRRNGEDAADTETSGDLAEEGAEEIAGLQSLVEPEADGQKEQEGVIAAIQSAAASAGEFYQQVQAWQRIPRAFATLKDNERELVSSSSLRRWLNAELGHPGVLPVGELLDEELVDYVAGLLDHPDFCQPDLLVLELHEFFGSNVTIFQSVMKFLVWQAGDFGYDSAAHVLSALVLLPLG